MRHQFEVTACRTLLNSGTEVFVKSVTFRRGFHAWDWPIRSELMFLGRTSPLLAGGDGDPRSGIYLRDGWAGGSWQLCVMCGLGRSLCKKQFPWRSGGHRNQENDVTVAGRRIY